MSNKRIASTEIEIENFFKSSNYDLINCETSITVEKSNSDSNKSIIPIYIQLGPSIGSND